MAEDISFLFEVVSSVTSQEEMARLLEDWLTPHELEELVLRLDIVRRLHQGQTYEVIQHETGASSTTISRVRRCLFHGAGGYRSVMDRLFPATR